MQKSKAISDSIQVEQEISKLTSYMTVEEKVSLCHGETLFRTAGI